MEPLVKVHCLKHTYPDRTQVNLCGLDFVVHEGQRAVVLGSNGAGKTTLLSHILGLLSPTEGTVEVMGMRPDKNFSEIRKKIGVVFQNVDEQIIGPRVYDDIAFTLRNERLPRDEIEQRVHLVAEKLGIENLLEKIPHYLSGGQKKKVGLAGAIVRLPKLLIMDEPFDFLDPKSKYEMVDLLNHLNREHGITMILTTHNINLVPSIADIIYVISDGKIINRGTPEEVFCHLEAIKMANIEPPLLTELFLHLRKRGYNVKMPWTMGEAVDELLALLNQEKKLEEECS
ncbi:MAG: ATP-binding cassette domain-containing protein [Bacillota bacterium]